MLHNKFWQGFFALAPFIMFLTLIIGYFFFVISIIRGAESGGSDQMVASYILGNLGGLVLLIALTAFIALGSLVFYILHAVKNPNLQDNSMLIVWILLFIFISGIGQFIYWIVEILGKNREPNKLQ